MIICAAKGFEEKKSSAGGRRIRLTSKLQAKEFVKRVQ